MSSQSVNPLVVALNDYRGKIGTLDDEITLFKDELPSGEPIANLMLAHRHLEDARMRLGKVIQAIEGGVSILDHPEVKAVIEKVRRG